MTLARKLVLVVASVCLMGTATLAGPVHIEVGDAGDFPAGTAQNTGSGALDSIQGFLGIRDFDAYVINIFDPANFSATTVDVNGVQFDTRLWLFNCDTTPFLGNDDDPRNNTLNSHLSQPDMFPVLPLDPTRDIVDPNAAPLTAGLYVLIIGAFSSGPQDAANVDLFTLEDIEDLNVGGFPGLWGPNPAAGPFDHWAFPSGSMLPGAYQINLTGVQGADKPVPEPAALWLVGMGLAGLIGIRRKRS